MSASGSYKIVLHSVYISPYRLNLGSLSDSIEPLYTCVADSCVPNHPGDQGHVAVYDAGQRSESVRKSGISMLGRALEQHVFIFDPLPLKGQHHSILALGRRQMVRECPSYRSLEDSGECRSWSQAARVWDNWMGSAPQTTGRFDKRIIESLCQIRTELNPNPALLSFCLFLLTRY